MERKKVTIPELIKMKQRGEKITMLTAYDYPLASILDQAGIEMILVGDSLGNVVLGYDSTVPVTMREMLHHAKAARRAVKYALVIGDMPFMSFNVSIESAIRNAGRFMKEAGCDAVKLESASDEVVKTTRAIVNAGIPVQGHLGLTPQTASMLGGMKVQGKNADEAKKIVDQAMALEQAGAFSIVLECVPETLAQEITKKLKVPTIGIGAGKYCDGQVLVTYDMLGLFERFTPKFVKKYADLSAEIKKATGQYIEEVKKGAYPDKGHSY